MAAQRHRIIKGFTVFFNHDSRRWVAYINIEDGRLISDSTEAGLLKKMDAHIERNGRPK